MSFGLEQRVSILPWVVFPTTFLLSDWSQTSMRKAALQTGGILCLENVELKYCGTSEMNGVI